MLAKEIKPGFVVNYNDAPHIIESVTVQSPSARGSATLYKFRDRNLVTKQKTDITPKGTDGLDDAAASFQKLSDTYVRVGERAEELLAPRTTADVDAGKPSNLMSTLARVDAAVTDARKWVGDDALHKDAREAITKAADLFNRAGELVDSWTRAAGTSSARSR